MEYVVLAEFRARPEHSADFAAFVDGHAARSRAEPGCLVFDVVQDAADPAVFLLYEVYVDEAAYAAHRAQPYHPRFFEVAGPMLVPGRDERGEETLFVSRRVLRRRPPGALPTT